MLNHIVKVLGKKIGLGQQNVMSFFIQGTYFKIYVIIASMIKRFKQTIALKCLDQRMKYHVAVFAIIFRKHTHIENLNNLKVCTPISTHV